MFHERADSRRSVLWTDLWPICVPVRTARLPKLAALFYTPQVHVLVYNLVQVFGFTDLGARGSNMAATVVNSVEIKNDCN